MKRLLIISYHWPPAGGVTSLRTLRFVPRLEDHGWRSVIATATPEAYERLDPALSSEIPAGTEVLRIPAWSPYGWYRKFVRESADSFAEEAIARPAPTIRHRLALWIRANAFIPDAKSPWIRPAVAAIERYLVDNPVDAIFTSGPPHTNTEVASRIKKLSGIPWLADFQDPWSELGYFERLPLLAPALARHRFLERRALARADAITAASPTWTDDLARLGARRPSFLPWGFDEREFSEWSEPPPSRTWRLCHLGTLGADRNPAPLVEALDRTGVPWRLDLAGAADRVPAHPSVFSHGFLPRSDALSLLRRSDAAVVWINRLRGQRGRIPAKLYEAIRSLRPVLVVGDPDGDAAGLVEDLGAGVTCLPEPAALDAALTRLRNWKNHCSASLLRPFDLDRLTETLAAKLRDIAPGS